jgi:hypothetical protein
MVSGFADMRFRAFLLFRPAAGEDPDAATWVPLGVVAWSWSGSISFQGNPQQDPWPECGRRYAPLVCPHPVSNSNPQWTETTAPPTWTGYHVTGPLSETRQTTTNPAEPPPVSGGWGCP